MANGVGRSSKRVRSDDSEGSADSESQSFDDLTRDEEFWLEDGNIVLVAGKRGFKIYRGLLAVQSPVFADMFSTANPDVSQLYDGCPVIRLSDSAEDLRHLLHALLPRAEASRVSLADDSELSCTFNQLSSLTRLGHKYQIEFIECRAIARLKLLYTDTFQKWDECDAPFDVGDGQEIGVVCLARLTNNPAMLPVAFYLCSIRAGAVAHGWTREDGTVEMLEADDLERCINGYGVLQTETSDSLARIFKFYDNPLCNSAQKVSCNHCLFRFHELAGAHPRRYYLQLHAWNDQYEQWMEDENIKLCPACLQALCARHKDERRALWCRLPEIFRLSTLDGWET
ncbi:hypothetical protein LXA43DRAFT_81874 [Ganoderma leucocontextum]|nr:hypothetical protein LXA43DRAFT_81874 [Ganoderma leucocontextum]